MRHLIVPTILAMLSLPSPGAAQIPVDTPEVATFLHADGTPFRAPTLSIAVDGDVAVAGDPANDTFGLDVGIVYLFKRQTDGRWLETATLRPADPADCDGFGHQVDIKGGVILVQRRGRGFIPGHGCVGSFIGRDVRVFEHIGDGWIQTANFHYAFRSNTIDLTDTYTVIGKWQGADVYRHVAPGVWEGPTFLPQLGSAGGDDDFHGVTADISGNRIVIGTLADASGAVRRTAFFARANVYDLDAAGNWQMTADIITDKVRLGMTRDSPPVSIWNDYLAIGGVIYQRDLYGQWNIDADLSIEDASLQWNADIDLREGSIALVSSAVWVASDTVAPGSGIGAEKLSRNDIYYRGTDSLWRAVSRVEPSGDRSRAALQTRYDAKLPLIGHDPDGYVFAFEVEPRVAREVPSISSARIYADVIVDGGTSTEVQLHVSADDYNYDANPAGIRKIEYRVGNGEWQVMTPIDGGFGGKYESAFAAFLGTANVATTPAETRICVRVTGEDGRVGELVDRGAEVCPVLEIFNRADFESSNDHQPPTAYEFAMYRDQVLVGQDNSVYAFADDTSRGQSPLVAMQYRIDDGVWRQMKPADGRFGLPGDAPTYGTGFAVLPPMGQLGHHSVCVRAIDASANIGYSPCQSFEVIR